MRYLLAILFVFPTFALASTATVRSGEHGNFARFVVAMLEPGPFSSASGPLEISITMAGIDTVRLDQAFDRVKRERVTDISFTDGVLRFTKGCACTERIYAIGTNLIVVDVYDPGAQPPGAEEPAPVADAETAVEPRPLSGTLPVVVPVRQERTGVTLFRPDIRLTPAESVNTADPEPLAGAQAEAQLAQDIGIALTQGVLSFDAANDRRPNPKKAVRPEGSMPPDLGAASVGAQAYIRDGLANLRTSGPIDGLARSDGGSRLAGIGSDCSKDRNYALSDWVSDKPFSEVIPRLRRELVLEFDAVDPAVALELARTYAAFGFGAEAISVLDLVQDVSASFEVARNIAKIIEYGTDLNEPMPISQLECPGSMSFWTALSMERLPRDVMFDEDAAIRELNALPKTLRAVLAPELSKRLRERGSTEKASLIMRGAARTEETMSTKGQIETNELLADEMRSDAHEEPLYAMLADGAVEAPVALISFIKKQVRNGKDISPETALLAESYALQFRGTEIEKDLIAAHMIALAQSGQFREAIELLRETPLPNEDYNESIADLFSTLTKSADDVTFLKYALLPLEEKQMSVEEDIRLMIAERALDLGFDKVAERLLGTIAKRKTSRSFERLMGELMLRKGLHDLALAFLERSETSDVSAARAEALFESGQYEQAAQAFESLGDAGQSYEAAFRSANVQTPDADVAGSIDALRRLQAARPELTDEAGAPDSLGMAQALIGVSEALISDTRLLLSATEF
jgi:tetratricopeptide (TPR) repeat protein